MEEIKNRGRNYILPFLALLKRNIVGAFEIITKNNIFNVKVTNDKVVYSYMANLVSHLTQIEKSINYLQTLLRNPPKIEVPPTKLELKIPAEKLDQISQELKRLAEVNQIETGKVVNNLVGLGKLLNLISSGLGRIKLEIPQIQKITGRVDIDKMPPIYDFGKIYNMLFYINEAVKKIKFEVPKQDIRIPDFPKSFSITEGRKILEALDELSNQIKSIKFPKIEFPDRLPVDVITAPPQKYPMPVTHISINALAGTVISRSVTVTTSLTPLPEEVLDQRRALVIYNNSTSTVEIGGSTFTFGNGMPIPSSTYSPAFDAGEKTIVYGRVSTGTANVRTLEISDIDVGR